VTASAPVLRLGGALRLGGVLLSAGLAAGLAGTAAAAAAAAPPGGSLAGCTAAAYAAVQHRQLVTATPPACRGLSRAQVSQAAGTAIRESETGRSKSQRRRQAIAASRWLPALITDPVPAAPAPPAAAVARPPAGAGRGLGLGGVSELAAKAGALLAWLAAAASGGWVLARWLLAGGRPSRAPYPSTGAAAAPATVILGHVGGGALGLLLWVSFLLSGWAPLAWTAVGLLAPVAGLGMGMLLLGLPSPARPAIGRRPGRRARVPALAIAAHGLFAVTALLLTLMAAIGAG